MKKFSRIIAAAMAFYLLLALGVGYQIYHIKSEQSNAYRVEINRIFNSLSGDSDLGRLSLDDYRYVKQIEYLPMSESGQAQIEDFFQEGSRFKTVVLPWFEGKSQMGYLKFYYIEQGTDIKRILFWVQLSLAMMAAFILGVLLFVKKRLLKPFDRMNQLPLELAKGHLKEDITDEKSRYFGNFLWGIGQLKDTLEVTKKRQLQLEKEKKQMLLSLSHDTKTPLNTIYLYTKALDADVYETEEQKKNAIRQIGEKAREIERYVDEIMKSSREDILDIRVENSEFYLSNLMEKVLGTYEDKCHVRMTTLEVGTFENRILKGDLDKAREIFENLFENAFKYGDGRRIQISFYEEEYCQLIRVFNTGKPVTDNDFNHIFESFFRGSNSTGQSGNGLGLYICREIMQKMGGEIFAEIESEGMSFVLVFQ